MPRGSTLLVMPRARQASPVWAPHVSGAVAHASGGVAALVALAFLRPAWWAEGQGCRLPAASTRADLPAAAAALATPAPPPSRCAATIRLVNAGVPSGSGVMQGRLEVQLPNGTWSTVCDDSFSDASASVACRQASRAAGGLGGLQPEGTIVPVAAAAAVCLPRSTMSLLPACPTDTPSPPLSCPHCSWD